MGLAVGRERPQLEAAHHSEKSDDLTALLNGPVKSTTFREARAVPEFGLLYEYLANRVRFRDCREARPYHRSRTLRRISWTPVLLQCRYVRFTPALAWFGFEDGQTGLSCKMRSDFFCS